MCMYNIKVIIIMILKNRIYEYSCFLIKQRKKPL